MQNEEELLAPAQIKNYSLRIGENLYQRINKHIHLLKHLDNHSHSKKRWIVEAIKEKIEIEQDMAPEDIPKERFIGFTVDEYLSEKIEKRIDLVRRFRVSFSKKLWFVEAIYEKLDRDERKARKLLDNLTEIQKK